MSETKFDIDTIVELLNAITEGVSTIKMETKDFGLDGYSAGLNSFDYAYTRLANALVEYRSLVRDNVSDVCCTINGFIELDNSLAVSYNSSNSSALQDLNELIVSVTDSSGAQSLPSINVSYFKIMRMDVENFQHLFSSFITSVVQNSVDYQNRIKIFSESDALTGDTADAIKLYWKEAHIPLIQAISVITMQLNQRLYNYIAGLNSLLFDELYYVLPQEEMENTIMGFTSIKNSLESIVNSIDSIVANNSLGISLPAPNGQPMLIKYQQMIDDIQTQINSIIEFESTESSEVKNYIDEFYDQFCQLITELNNQEAQNYTAGSFQNFSGSDYITEIAALYVEKDINETLVDIYVETADGDISNLTDEQIALINDYIDDQIENRYGGKADVIEMRNSDSSDEIGRLIRAYELLNPGDAEIVNDFLAPLKDPNCNLGYNFTEDYENICYILYTAEEPYRSVYLYSISELNGIKIMPDTNPDNTNNTSNYNSGQGVIYYTVSTIGSSERVPYQTFLHELGHVVDDVTFGSGVMNYNYEINGQTLYNILTSELDSAFGTTLDTICADNNYDLSVEQKEILLNHITSSERFWDGNYPSDWTSDMQKAYDEFRNYYGYYEYSYNGTELTIVYHNNNGQAILDNEYYTLSDVYAGYTNNEICSTGGHICRKPQFEAMGFDPANSYTIDQMEQYLNDYSYWYGGADSNVKPSLSSEFFANYSSTCILGTSDDLSTYHEALGESTQFIDEYYESVYEDLQ